MRGTYASATSPLDAAKFFGLHLQTPQRSSHLHTIHLSRSWALFNWNYSPLYSQSFVIPGTHVLSNGGSCRPLQPCGSILSLLVKVKLIRGREQADNDNNIQTESAAPSSEYYRSITELGFRNHNINSAKKKMFFLLMMFGGWGGQKCEDFCRVVSTSHEIWSV